MTGPVCVGLTTLDVIHTLPGTLAVGVKSLASSTVTVAGGPAANAAITCAAITGGCTLITGLGASAAASSVRAELESLGVRVIDCAPADFVLPVASAVIETTGERTVVSPGATSTTFTLSPDAAAAVTEADVILLDGHHPGLARGALDCDAIRVLDAGSAKPYAEQWLPRLDILAASADYAVGLGLGSVEQVVQHGLTAGAAAVVVTDGAGPICWATGADSGLVEPSAVVAVDTLGAGDAFHGALLAGLTWATDWKQQLPELVSMAAQVASLRVAVPGPRAWLSRLPSR